MINNLKNYPTIIVISVTLLTGFGCSQGSSSFESELSDVLNCPRSELEIVRYTSGADYLIAVCGSRAYDCEWEDVAHEHKVGGADSDLWEEYYTRGPIRCYPRN